MSFFDRFRKHHKKHGHFHGEGDAPPLMTVQLLGPIAGEHPAGFGFGSEMADAILAYAESDPNAIGQPLGDETQIGWDTSYGCDVGADMFGKEFDKPFEGTFALTG